ncbi:undecaprenyldiphospho-muramoylpentapeptide beta-N-acetylglucosaminyltransferase [Thermosulfurimonas marina]|uniref:UDP-N-acetylglucosamine--N-acetylmuramyl-(pentapeptide) pyrophosphoryl-undecaprenol N-acetylglucosamine transferase n=1 Tax=Thermosulfurimonas marina TaxID=2047767 RepID=A0A6H1WRG4_9BACT|nr:undecaprenyldiphospho-muramoylpentapeptide beta-N-acetylglucosaminyltransferase [Thermosulfurimonas marina]QJA05758.1 undecaprenyldiphospho-muramoylpentapeptide beta-N-acetylglucosaminyltransferase [Thermosulfurimonas marina]
MRWVIAGGGTGGHLFPALALAEALVARGREVMILGCGRRVEALALSGVPYPVATISGEGFLGRGLWGKTRALARLLWGVLQALRILRRWSAEVVFGTGGYASVPALGAGFLLRLPLGLHEPNAVPGLANRLLGHLVQRIFVTYPDTREHFPSAKVRVSGTPVRASLLEERPREHSGPGLLVLGGSQGARTLNRLLVETAPELYRRLPDLYLLHQTGERDFGWVKEAYRKKGLPVEVRAFIRDMAWAYAQADLVVTRAGASTVAELCALGKPALYIPYPYATHRHQEANARTVVERGGGLLFQEAELSPEIFVETVGDLLLRPAKLSEMGRRARELFRPGATETIIEEMEALVHA